MSERYCNDYDKDFFDKGLRKLPFVYSVRGRSYAGKRGDEISAKTYAKRICNRFRKTVYQEMKNYIQYLDLYLDEFDELVGKYEDSIDYYNEKLESFKGKFITFSEPDATDERIILFQDMDDLCCEYDVIKYKIFYDLKVLRTRLVSSDKYHRRRIRAFMKAAVKENPSLKADLDKYYSAINFTADSLINEIINGAINSDKNYCFLTKVIESYLDNK